MSKRKITGDSSFDQESTPGSKKQKLNGTPPLDEVNSHKVQDDNAALIAAVREGKADVIAKLLEKGADPNHAAENGCTALMYAAQNGHKDVVESLLENGANPSAAKRDGWTALMYAAQNGHKDVVELLLENYADPNQVTEYDYENQNQQNTALSLALDYCYQDRFNHFESVKTLLKNGADPNQVLIGNEGQLAVALESALARCNAEAMKLLFEYGVDPYFTHSNEYVIFTTLEAIEGRDEDNEMLEIFTHGKQVVDFCINDQYMSDSEEIDTVIDSDFFMSVYKGRMLRKGFDGKSFNDRKAEYSKLIEDNSFYPQDVLGKIESLFADIKDNFMFKCSELFCTITGEKISPVPLSQLISQSQERSFVAECNEYTKNLIKFYTDKGINFSIDIENLLSNKVQVDDKAIEALKEEIYVANINILQNNIEEFMLGGNEVYVFIRDLITTTILPSSIRDSLGKAVENYKQLQANPLFSIMTNQMNILTTEKDALIKENEEKAALIAEKDAEIQSMQSALESPIKVENVEDHLFATEDSSDMLVIGKNDEFTYMAADT